MTTTIMVSEEKITNVPAADMDDEEKIHIVLEAQMNIQAGKKIAVPAKEKQHGYSVPKKCFEETWRRISQGSEEWYFAG